MPTCNKVELDFWEAHLYCQSFRFTSIIILYSKRLLDQMILHVFAYFDFSPCVYDGGLGVETCKEWLGSPIQSMELVAKRLSL